MTTALRPRPLRAHKQQTTRLSGMGDTSGVEPLIWLTLPVVVTILAAIVLLRRDRRPATPDDAERLRRIRRGLGGS